MFLKIKQFVSSVIPTKTILRIFAVPVLSFFRYGTLYPVFILLTGGLVFAHMGLAGLTQINLLGFIYNLFTLPAVFPFNLFPIGQTHFNEQDALSIWARIALILVIIDYVLAMAGVTWHRSTEKSIRIFLAILTIGYVSFWFGLPFIERAENSSLSSFYLMSIFFYLLSCAVVYINFHIAGLFTTVINVINSDVPMATEEEAKASMEAYEALVRNSPKSAKELQKKFWENMWG